MPFDKEEVTRFEVVRFVPNWVHIQSKLPGNGCDVTVQPPTRTSVKRSTIAIYRVWNTATFLPYPNTAGTTKMSNTEKDEALRKFFEYPFSSDEVFQVRVIAVLDQL